MNIYIASSWKNQHAVEMLTAELRRRDHTVLTFVENNYGENPNSATRIPLDEWCASEAGYNSFVYDTDGAMHSDLVIYIGPSGVDAWAELGAAYASGVKIYGLWAKGEQSGLMRRMVTKWYDSYRDLLADIA